MIRVAVVDCGTNTFNLLVAEAHATGWKKIFQSKLPVKLGAGGFEKREIIPARFIRGIDALFCHRQNIINLECRHTLAFGTSALRETTNGREFVDYALRVAQIPIEVIGGEREAELIFKGVIQTIALESAPVLVMDIGGGSTEFIIGNNQGILWRKSFTLGISRLTERVRPSDRLTHHDTANLRNILVGELSALRDAMQQHQPHVMIGSSGSFDTMLALYRHQARIETPAAAANEIPLSALPAIHAWLSGSTLEERMKHPAIPPIRAEFMPLASFLIKYVLELHPFVKLMHSDFSLKEGALAEWIEKTDWASVSPQPLRVVPDVE